MFTFLTILAILVCLFLILFILIQNPKGGGLTSSFGASNQIMGVQKTGDFLEKTTWGLAIALLVICLSMKVFSPGTSRDNEPSEIQKQLEKTSSGSPAGNGIMAPSRSTKPSASPAAVPVNPGTNGSATPAKK
jgi:preprotein translocase subunit SecG